MSQKERSLGITLITVLWMVVGVVTILLGGLFIIRTTQLISLQKFFMDQLVYQIRLFIVLLITILFTVSSFYLGHGFWKLKKSVWRGSVILSAFTGIVCILQIPQNFVFSQNIMRFYLPQDALFIVDIFFISLILISGGMFVCTLLVRDYFEQR